MPSLSKADSLVRAYISASAALCASVRVDWIDVASRDCLRWTLVNTCTASDTIVANYVSHSLDFLVCYNVLYVSAFMIGYCKGRNLFWKYLQISTTFLRENVFLRLFSVICRWKVQFSRLSCVYLVTTTSLSCSEYTPYYYISPRRQQRCARRREPCRTGHILT